MRTVWSYKKSDIEDVDVFAGEEEGVHLVVLAVPPAEVREHEEGDAGVSCRSTTEQRNSSPAHVTGARRVVVLVRSRR